MYTLKKEIGYIQSLFLNITKTNLHILINIKIVSKM